MSAREHEHQPEAVEAPAERRRTGDRVEAAAALIVALAIIVIPALLTPDPSGHGTHTQILLLPCIFEMLTGLPCPMCGMTTSMAHMARGEVAAAFATHLLGPALYVGAWPGAAWALAALVRGTSAVPALLRRPIAPKVFLTVIAVAWAGNIAIRLLR